MSSVMNETRIPVKPASGDVVFSVPDSSNAMALGFSEVSFPAPVRHAYGDHPDQWADLYLPEGPPRGAVVVIFRPG